MTPTGPASEPPVPASVLAVCAHPDDETFGLGAVISTLVAHGSRVEVLCLTRGGASTLGAGDDLASRRVEELRCAADTLGIARVMVADHPDGALHDVPLDALAAEVAAAAGDADALLVYDHGGITGHPDHQRATDAAVAASGDRTVLAWTLPEEVATTLNHEFGASFVGRPKDQLTHRITVDRARQLRALACHGSQLADNPVPRRRLQLQGDVETLRILT